MAKLPEVDELVICKVVNITPYAAWCELKEYNARGMIHLNEVAPRIIKNIKHYVKENKEYVAKVIKVDKNKNFVYLSLKRVSKFEERKKWDEYRKNVRGEKILEEIVKRTSLSKEELKQQLLELHSNIYDVLVEIKKNPALLNELKIPKKYHKQILETLEKNIKEKITKIKVQLTLASYEGNGIERIKSLLLHIQNETKAKITYISAPNYLMTIQTTNPKQKEKQIISLLEKIKKERKMDVFDYRVIK